MKRRNFIKHLVKHKCHLCREGKKHAIYCNAHNGKTAAVPRHQEIKNILCKEICKELEIDIIV
jgi:mRNA interferase HicA